MRQKHDSDHFSRTDPMRTAHSGTCPDSAPTDRADSSTPRTPPQSSSPLQRARETVAAELDGLLEERWARGDDSASNRAIAERHVGVNEQTIRKWRTGDKPIPLAALLVLPESVATELWRRVMARRIAKASAAELVSMQRDINDALAAKLGAT